MGNEWFEVWGKEPDSSDVQLLYKYPGDRYTVATVLGASLVELLRAGTRDVSVRLVQESGSTRPPS